MCSLRTRHGSESGSRIFFSLTFTGRRLASNQRESSISGWKKKSPKKTLSECSFFSQRTFLPFFLLVLIVDPICQDVRTAHIESAIAILRSIRLPSLIASRNRLLKINCDQTARSLSRDKVGSICVCRLSLAGRPSGARLMPEATHWQQKWATQKYHEDGDRWNADGQ